MPDKVIKTEEDWEKDLSPEQYDVLRRKGTDAPFAGEYVHAKDDGVYTCAACDLDLFSSETKFDSHSGWPSFWDVTNNDNIILNKDSSNGMTRVEVTCARCGSHLGHLFDDGPADKTGQRYCVNSTSLKLDKNKGANMTNSKDLFEDEEKAKREENFSEPDGLVKSVGGDIEQADENTIEAQEMHKGVGDTDPKGTYGFHIEDENGKDQS